MSDKDKPTVLLDYYLKKLRLPTMLREYASMATVCQKDRTDFPTYLLRLTERELLDREKRAAERRVKDASFPVLKTLDTFDFKAQPSINEQLVRELMRGEYIDKRENVLIIGNPGTGKTHLACALAFSACAHGRKVRFYTVTGLVTELVECREERRLQRLQKQLQRFHLLILDEPTRGIDVGTKAEIQKLVLSLADEGKSCVFISSELEEVLRTSHRIIVLREREKVAEFSGEVDENTIIHAIAGSEA